jgi:hypothetical protein
MWVAAFPGHRAYDGQATAAAWYERDAGPEIDVHEAELRRRLRQPRRRLPDDLTCDGGHGSCRFAAEPGPQVRRVPARALLAAQHLPGPQPCRPLAGDQREHEPAGQRGRDGQQQQQVGVGRLIAQRNDGGGHPP